MSASLLARAVGAVLSLATLGSAASAQIAAGSRLDFAGTVNATDIGADGIVLDFVPGTIETGATSTGIFAGLTAAKGAIRGITVGVGPIALQNFVTVGGYRFDVSYIPVGSFGQDQCYVMPAVGQTCTPIQSPAEHPSPFDLTNFDSGNPDAPIRSVAAFHLLGTVTGPGGISGDFFGMIATSFPTMSFQEALQTVETTGIDGIHYTASFVVGTPTTTAPEPSTWALVASGLVVLGGVVRRRSRTAARQAL